MSSHVARHLHPSARLMLISKLFGGLANMSGTRRRVLSARSRNSLVFRLISLVIQLTWHFILFSSHAFSFASLVFPTETLVDPTGTLVI
jgi:hypothetical protein